MAQVARHVGIGHAHRGAAGQERAVLERLVAAANVGRVRELNILAGQQELHRPGLQSDQRCALLILLGAVLAHHDLVVDVAGDADAARLGETLQACGDVDAIAEDVTVIEDDVAPLEEGYRCVRFSDA